MLDNYRSNMAKVSLGNDLKAVQEKKEMEREILLQAW
jgi:hypothetical protein